MQIIQRLRAEGNGNRLVAALVRNPVVITFVVCLLLLAVNIVFVGRLRPFNSDDLYWQQVVRTWHPFSGRPVYLGTQDTFIEEVPFFEVMEHLFSPSRKLLIAEAGTLTLASFTMFYYASLYFIRKLRVKPTYLMLLPFVWLASFGFPIVQNYLNIDWRTFEVGCMFLAFMFFAAISFKDFDPLRSWWSRFWAVLVALGLGLLMYSDPYFTFFAMAPIGLAVTALWALRLVVRRQALVMYGLIVLSLLFSKVIEHIGIRAGIDVITNAPSMFVSFDYIVTNLVTSLHGLLIVFGADFFGRPSANLVTFGMMINAVLLGVLLWHTCNFRRLLSKDTIRKINVQQFWLIFLGLLVPFVFLIYTLSSLVAIYNYRYFITLMYGGVTFLALLIGMSKRSLFRYVIGALLVAATLFNMAYTTLSKTVISQPYVQNNVRNAINFQLIDVIKGQGLSKGYANYWQGNINTYLSHGQVTSLPVLCSPEGKVSPYHWLIDSGQFNRPASRTFFILDPDISDPATCTPAQLAAQFGAPQKTLQVSDKTILIYNYDILTRMGHRYL